MPIIRNRAREPPTAIRKSGYAVCRNRATYQFQAYGKKGMKQNFAIAKQKTMGVKRMNHEH